MGFGRRVAVGLGLLALVGALPAAGVAGDAASEFSRGTAIVGLQVGGGVQVEIPDPPISDLVLLNVTPRLSYLFWDPLGPGWLRGSPEVGLEGWFQYFVEPVHATGGGVKAALRYHFLEFGPVVPYLELLAGVGGTTLKVRELRSELIFVLEAGVGFSYFISKGVAINAGYRFHHLSNAGLERPNKGINANAGIVGVSFFFH